MSCIVVWDPTAIAPWGVVLWCSSVFWSCWALFCVFSTTAKVVGTVRQGVDVRIFIQRSHTPFLSLRDMPYSVTICLWYRHERIRAYIMCTLVERLFLFPAAHSQIVAPPRPNVHLHSHCQSTCRFSFKINITTYIFLLDATFNCILLTGSTTLFDVLRFTSMEASINFHGSWWNLPWK